MEIKAINILANIIRIRLLTLKIILKLKSILKTFKNIKKEHIKLLKQLNINNKKVIKRLKLIKRKARKTNKIKERTLLKD